MYKCKKCRFNLDVRCAALVLPYENQQEDRKAVEHFSHQCQLEMENMGIRCRACDLKISGEVYGCPDSIFFIHRSCTQELPQEMLHFLHPDHPLIFRAEPPCDGRRFRCDSCSIKSCSLCSVAKDVTSTSTRHVCSAFKEGVPTEIPHFSHDHPLNFHHCQWRRDDCKACGSAVMASLAYFCRTFSNPMLSYGEAFVLHEACAELPQQLEHPFHPPYPLTLSPVQSDTTLCTKGFTYCCTECRFHSSLQAATLRQTLN
ncbi:hypothetical protein CDL15_Pgr000765 [Punica granatum]|nr:hypothetical protein CDL15_Pgr000765 [Punica granatum]